MRLPLFPCVVVVGHAKIPGLHSIRVWRSRRSRPREAVLRPSGRQAHRDVESGWTKRVLARRGVRERAVEGGAVRARPRCLTQRTRAVGRLGKRAFEGGTAPGERWAGTRGDGWKTRR